MVSKAIIDMLIKKLPDGGFDPSRLLCKQTRYQLNCCRELKGTYLYESYEATVREVKKEMVLQRNSGVSTPNTGCGRET
jgi:hypothetical protein